MYSCAHILRQIAECYVELEECGEYVDVKEVLEHWETLLERQ